MFPVGYIYGFLYDFRKNTNKQIKNNIKTLNNMIGKWEYYGVMAPAIYFVRKK